MRSRMLTAMPDCQGTRRRGGRHPGGRKRRFRHRGPERGGQGTSKMRYVVICGGTGIDIRRLKRQILPSDHILCADGGSVHARKMGIIPDAIIGDMDSIDTETSEWAEANRIPLREYPAEKDMTDSELCLSEVPEREEILLVLPFCGRFDHVL